ncbi:MAG: hypothetical protein KDB80_11670 [Planctomycetes bacterium]|nr:hypothetical protein [Planctomycetota bacterium]
MRVAQSTLLGLGVLGLSAGLAAQEPSELTAELSYKALKKWSFNLPNETWSDVKSGIPIAHQNGDSFEAHMDGLALALAVDTDGDGRTDKTVKGAKGYLVLRAKDKAGETMQYAVRFQAKDKAYQFATSGVMRGKLNGVAIMLIDQNNNGLYNEIGVDAMIVGKGDSASFLSRIVNLDDELFEITVSADGKKIEATPFTGDVGKIDLESGFRASGKLVSAVVNSSDGKSSFEISSGETVVPAGDYTLAFGLVSKANESVNVRHGKMKTLTVDAGRTTSQKWGSEVMADFTFGHSGENVTIEPSALKYYGQSGEEYYAFQPMAKSPKFFVFDERTEKLLKTGRFGT